MELLDARRLEDAQTTDARYHAAKLQSWAFLEPQLIHDEHAAFRSGVLTTAEPTATLDVLAVGAAMWKRALEKGIILPQSGAN